MSKLKSLIPCRENHSVKEAVLTVFVDAPISDVSSFKDLEQHGILEHFKRFELVNQNQFKISLKHSTPNVDAKKVNEVGFKFVDYNDGKSIKVFQGMNEENRFYFSFHDLAYNRWEQFKNLFDTCISLLSKHKGKFHVKAYSLHVIDEFNWIEKSPIPYKDIFRDNNKIIPAIFNESTSIDFLISRNHNVDVTGSTRDGIERIQINGVNNENALKSKLIISHNYTEIMNDTTEALILIQSNEFAKKITGAHKQNKELIKELLNDEVLKIIHYN